MVSIRPNQTDFPGADLLVDMILFGANYSSLARFSDFPDIPLYDVVLARAPQLKLLGTLIANDKAF